MDIYVRMRIEPKESAPDPDPRVVCTRVGDVLNDVTKHDETLDWRVSGEVELVGV